MSVTVQVKLGGATVPGDVVLADVALRSGRQRSDDGLNTATATVDFLTATPGGLVIAIAQTLQVLVNGTSRFIGKISEITMQETADGPIAYTVVAAGNIAQLERWTIPVPIVAETAAARAQRAITEAGFTATIQGGTTYNMGFLGKLGTPPPQPQTFCQRLCPIPGRWSPILEAGRSWPSSRKPGSVAISSPQTLT